MGAESTSTVVELSDGLSLVPCTVVSLSFMRADVSVNPVDEWLLKEGLTALFRKRLGIAIADRDLVVHREKNYYKKRRDEPIADGVLHLWGGLSKGDAKIREGEDVGKYVVEKVNGVELNVGGLKLKCLAVITETNQFEAIKLSWETVFGPRRGGVAQAGPTTLTLKGVPSRWFAEPRVSSKASVLVTHTIFSKFGEIRNLEVIGNEDLGKNSKDVANMAAALQCQVWVQFESHASFCNALQALCGRAMQKAGSNFRATYVVDWDKDNYFSILNVRRRKFEKERLEQQERMEAERAQKEEARQAELALAEEERQKVEQAAAALREEEEEEEEGKQQQLLAEQAQKLEEEARKVVTESDSESASSEEEGLIQDEKQVSSDEDVQQNTRNKERHTSKDHERSLSPERENGRYMLEEEEGRKPLQAAEKRKYISDDEKKSYPSQSREKRRYTSEDEELMPSLQARNERRFMPKDKKEVHSPDVRDMRRDISEDEDEYHLRQGRVKRRYSSEGGGKDRKVQVRGKRRYSSEDEEELTMQQVREKRRYISEDEEERGPANLREKRRYTSEDEDEDERSPPQLRVKRSYTPEYEENVQHLSQTRDKSRYISKIDGGKSLPQSRDHRTHLSEDEESDLQRVHTQLAGTLERWQPEEETEDYPMPERESPVKRREVYAPNHYERYSKGDRSHRPARYSTESDESEDDRDVKRVEDLDKGEGNNLKVERWVLEVTHSVASSYATEMLSSAHDGDMGRFESSEKRLRSVVLISS